MKIYPITHSGYRVLSVGHLLVRRDRRLRVTGYFGMVISEVQLMDQGLYKCHVDYQGYVQHVQHRLIVLGMENKLNTEHSECIHK